MEHFVLSIKELLALLGAGGLSIFGLVKSGHLKLRIGKSGNSKPVTTSLNSTEHGKVHDKLDETIITWDKMAQTMILEQRDHKNTLTFHKGELKKGVVKMDEMQKEITYVDKGVAILLDRGGGDPREKK